VTSRRLDWTEGALADLAAIAEYSPVAALRAVESIEAMAAHGFNYGREVEDEPGQWYWPERPLGIYYDDDGRTLTVQRVVDVRRRLSPTP